MMEPRDGVNEQLKVGDRVVFQPPQRMVVGRVVEVVLPGTVLSAHQQVRYGRIRIEVEIDHLYAIQSSGNQAQPLEGLFKLAEPAQPGRSLAPLN